MEEHIMTIHIMNSETGTDLLGAKIIHNEGGVLIIGMPSKYLPSDVDFEFWKLEEKTVLLDPENDLCFRAKSWTHIDQLGNVDILKFWINEQPWFYGIRL